MQSEIENMPAIFKKLSSRNRHNPGLSKGVQTIEPERWRIVEGINILYIWGSYDQSDVDAFATVKFFVASPGNLPLINIFLSRDMYEFVSKVAVPPPQPQNFSRNKKILVVTEIPPRGLDRTGDEHAVGVVVNAAKLLGVEIVINSRICGMSVQTCLFLCR